jgi:hypothetical protein
VIYGQNREYSEVLRRIKNKAKLLCNCGILLIFAGKITDDE